mmetsp:Transcript_25998/g.50586  ORF Transcript_25998/g.50586 Transcript_25998/m.50586 type:complete len:137 (-) Transcript_25998:127-537(-)
MVANMQEHILSAMVVANQVHKKLIEPQNSFEKIEDITSSARKTVNEMFQKTELVYKEQLKRFSKEWHPFIIENYSRFCSLLVNMVKLFTQLLTATMRGAAYVFDLGFQSIKALSTWIAGKVACIVNDLKTLASAWQ